MDSLLAITLFDYGVAVIDNGSTDKTREIISSYTDERIYASFLETNMGTTVARNIALKDMPPYADYVCILDSDTVINEAALNTLVETLEHNPDIGLIGPSMHDAFDNQQLSGRKLPSVGIKLRKACFIKAIQNAGENQERLTTDVVAGLQDADYLISACWLMPRTTIETVGLLDEKIFYAPEDADYCLRVWQAGSRVVWCHNAHIIHHYQRLSKKKFISRTNWEHIKGLIYYFRKYRYLFDSQKVLAHRSYL